jgi:iron(III) transport system ATP-binding protein
MGEAVLFDGQSMPDGTVQLGPLRLVPRHAVAPGAVRAAVRPEAWLVGRELLGSETVPGSLSAKLLQWSYLGSFVELTFETELGAVFVVSPEVEREWRIGQLLALSLPGRGVSVVAV